MLSSRKNQSRKVIAGKFKEFMREMRLQGRLMLPAERELCLMLECSRNNLRQVLDEYELSGDIVKKNRGRALSMEKATGKRRLGCFSFVVEGENMISNPTWNKLWMRLQPLAEADDLVPELIMISYHADHEETLQRIINGPEVVLLANTSSYDLTAKVLALPNKKIVILDEQFASPGKSMVTVDNYAVGMIAAQTLSKHGFKHPAWLCNDIRINGDLYKMYERRRVGFQAGCRKYKLEFDENSEFLVSGNQVQRLIRSIKFIEKLKHSHFDSIFVYSDDNIEYIYQVLIEEGIRVPDDMGLITVNSFDHAVGHNPCISSISHASHSVASRLVEELVSLFTDKTYNIGQIYLKPSIHKGTTL